MDINFSRGMATAKSCADLCAQCKHATVIVGHRAMERIVRCGYVGRDIPFPVTDCSQFYPATHPLLHEMEDIAWMLVTKKAGREVGFVKADEYRRMMHDQAPVPPHMEDK